MSNFCFITSYIVCLRNDLMVEHCPLNWLFLCRKTEKRLLIWLVFVKGQKDSPREVRLSGADRFARRLTSRCVSRHNSVEERGGKKTSGIVYTFEGVSSGVFPQSRALFMRKIRANLEGVICGDKFRSYACAAGVKRYLLPTLFIRAIFS